MKVEREATQKVREEGAKGERGVVRKVREVRCER